jgi:vacuolar-type H+-ATPase subunit I/STV1
VRGRVSPIEQEGASPTRAVTKEISKKQIQLIAENLNRYLDKVKEGLDDVLARELSGAGDGETPGDVFQLASEKVQQRLETREKINETFLKTSGMHHAEIIQQVRV